MPDGTQPASHVQEVDEPKATGLAALEKQIINMQGQVHALMDSDSTRGLSAKIERLGKEMMELLTRVARLERAYLKTDAE